MQVHAIRQDVPFTKPVSTAVSREIENLARCLPRSAGKPLPDSRKHRWSCEKTPHDMCCYHIQYVLEFEMDEAATGPERR
jgi:hypothetical protein